MQPTLEQIDQKLNMLIEMMTELVGALVEEAETVESMTLDGGAQYAERDQSLPL